MKKIYILCFFIPSILCMSPDGSKRIDQLMFATTHNAASNGPLSGWSSIVAALVRGITGVDYLGIANQKRTVLEQLNDGIRALEMRVHQNNYGEGDQPYVCHGLMISDVPSQWQNFVIKALSVIFCTSKFQPCDPDSTKIKLETFLSTVNGFLTQHPEELVVLLMNNQTSNPELLQNAFDKAQVLSKVYTHDNADTPWPSLDELRKQEKQLLVFIDGNQTTPYSYFHPVNTYVAASPYGYKTPADLLNEDVTNVALPASDAYQRLGKGSCTGLFALTHSVTPGLAGDENMAKEVNTYEHMSERVQKYQQKIGQRPNFVMVDFEDPKSSDLMKLIKEFNNPEPPVG